MVQCGSKRKNKVPPSVKTNQESQKICPPEEVVKKPPPVLQVSSEMPARSNPISTVTGKSSHVESTDRTGPMGLEATQMDESVRQLRAAVSENTTDLRSIKNNKNGVFDPNEDGTADGVPSLPKVNYSMDSEEINNNSKKSKNSRKSKEKSKKSNKNDKIKKTDKTMESDKKPHAKPWTSPKK